MVIVNDIVCIDFMLIWIIVFFTLVILCLEGFSVIELDMWMILVFVSGLVLIRWVSCLIFRLGFLRVVCIWKVMLRKVGKEILLLDKFLVMFLRILKVIGLDMVVNFCGIDY